MSKDKPPVRVRVLFDEDAQVFVAIGENMKGLVCEAPTWKELVYEIRTSIEALCEINHQPARSFVVIPVEAPDSVVRFFRTTAPTTRKHQGNANALTP